MPEIEPHEKRFIEGQDEAQRQMERDRTLAKAQPEAELMNRAEDSRLRQVLRLPRLLPRIKKHSGGKELRN